MQQRLRLVVAMFVGLSVVLVAAGCSGDDDGNAAPMGPRHADGEAGSDADDEGGSESDASPNTADLMFVTMMIPHHEQAVEMSEVVLSAPQVSPEVTDLATRITSAQSREIALMQGWLEDWGRDQMGQGMDGMGDLEGMAHHGMLDEEDLAELRAASGPRLQELFLEGMVEHHEGAIDMAEAELEDGQYPPVLDLAHDVVRTQQAEIQEMEDLLR